MSQSHHLENAILHALENEEFRQTLLNSVDPRETLERHIGVSLPDLLRVEIQQGQPDALAAAEQCQVIDGQGYTVYICRQNGVITVLQVFNGPFPYI